jgi:malonyl-CoA O-methyltransferase
MNALPPRDAYAAWAATYDSDPNPLIALETRLVRPLLPDLSGRLVADVAAGTGRWARFAADRGAHVIAVDFCPEMLSRAPRPAVLADASRLPLATATVDVAICAFGLSYTEACLDELARITRPGGSVVVSDMHPDAVRLGWTRGFSAEGRRMRVEQRPYRLADLRCPSLALVQLAESALGPADLSMDPARYERVKGVSAVYAGVWRRNDC